MEFVKKFTYQERSYPAPGRKSTGPSGVSQGVTVTLRAYVDQVRPLDQAHGHRPPDDRALRRRPGARRRDLLRRLLLRLRHARGAAVQDLRQRRDRPGPLFHRGRRRRVRVELRRQEGQVPGAAGNHAAEAVTDPYSVIAAAATARMTRSGPHPSSVFGTTICRKLRTKSNNPMSRPSSTVFSNPRPSWAGTLPISTTTAPCPAAIASAASMSPTSVCRK